MSLIEPATISRLGFRDTRIPIHPGGPTGFLRQARDGSVIRWGEADTPGPPPVVSPGLRTSITVAVSPVRPGHAVMVEYRANGGPVRQAMALPRPAPMMRMRACFGRSCRDNRAAWSTSSPSFASPDSRSRLASPSRPTAPAIRWARAQHRGRPHPRHRAQRYPLHQVRSEAHQLQRRPNWRPSRAGTGTRNFSGPAGSACANK